MPPPAPTPEPIDIFLSYKREEKPVAQSLARALAEAGWSVWWDVELRGGDRYDDVIGDALKRARCVIVLWSMRSVDSKYIQDEAALGLRDNKVIPVRLDDVEVPFRYQSLHIIDLRPWLDGRSQEKLAELTGDLEARLGAPGSPKPAPPEPAKSGSNKTTAVVVVAVLITSIAAFLLKKTPGTDCILDIKLVAQGTDRVPLTLAVRTGQEGRRIALQRDATNRRAQAKLNLNANEVSNWSLAIIWNSGTPSKFPPVRGCRAHERSSDDGLASLVATRL